MKKISLLFVASALAVGSAYACGGGEPAKNPTDVSSASATPSSAASTTDMPSATASATATATATATTPPAPEAPPLAIDGVKFTIKKDGKTLTAEVKADGSVSVTKEGKPAVVASFVKNELKDESGSTVFSVAADGKVTSSLGGKAMAFDDKDQLLVDGKPVLVIGDDGTPTVTDGGKSEKAPFKFDKLPPKSKRAALLLLSYFLFVGKPVAPPPATSGGPSPKPSAAPSAKPAH